jgi:hypothetical protein
MLGTERRVARLERVGRGRPEEEGSIEVEVRGDIAGDERRRAPREASGAHADAAEIVDAKSKACSTRILSEQAGQLRTTPSGLLRLAHEQRVCAWSNYGSFTL